MTTSPRARATLAATPSITKLAKPRRCVIAIRYVVARIFFDSRIVFFVG
ncbi:hypothetical protein AKJ09_00551 [Labilithrix luteola]|uniref:Uncharacterized protein n=1 Tax=Labilithrix luteola TaxID=1391654 RepID=A0A0K1PK44_9BACT|nr:hypothetical protein AKJ09_00551 [Labilithrix luteola]